MSDTAAISTDPRLHIFAQLLGRRDPWRPRALYVMYRQNDTGPRKAVLTALLVARLSSQIPGAKRHFIAKIASHKFDTDKYHFQILTTTDSDAMRARFIDHERTLLRRPVERYSPLLAVPFDSGHDKLAAALN